MGVKPQDVQDLKDPKRPPSKKVLLKGEGKRMALQLLSPEMRAISRAALQQKEARLCFATVDKDGGGSIDSKEMYKGLKKFGVTKDKEEAAAIMATIDTDGGGEVEIHEFLAAVEAGIIEFVPDMMADEIDQDKIDAMSPGDKFEKMVAARFRDYLDVLTRCASLRQTRRRCRP